MNRGVKIKMEISQLITGVIIIVLGVVLVIVGIFVWPVLIYAIPILIIGILILFNVGREGEVERIKTKRIKKNK